MTYFKGSPRFVTVCDKGAVKTVKNSQPYCMDDPQRCMISDRIEPMNDINIIVRMTLNFNPFKFKASWEPLQLQIGSRPTLETVARFLPQRFASNRGQSLLGSKDYASALQVTQSLPSRLFTICSCSTCSILILAFESSKHVKHASFLLHTFLSRSLRHK